MRADRREGDLQTRSVSSQGAPTTRTNLLKALLSLCVKMIDIATVASVCNYCPPDALRSCESPPPGLLEIGRIIKQYRQLDAPVPILREVGLGRVRGIQGGRGVVGGKQHQ